MHKVSPVCRVAKLAMLKFSVIVPADLVTVHLPYAAFPVLALSSSAECLELGGCEPFALSLDAAAAASGAETRLVELTGYSLPRDTDHDYAIKYSLYGSDNVR